MMQSNYDERVLSNMGLTGIKITETTFDCGHDESRQR